MKKVSRMNMLTHLNSVGVHLHVPSEPLFGADLLHLVARAKVRTS